MQFQYTHTHRWKDMSTGSLQHIKLVTQSPLQSYVLCLLRVCRVKLSAQTAIRNQITPYRRCDPIKCVIVQNITNNTVVDIKFICIHWKWKRLLFRILFTLCDRRGKRSEWCCLVNALSINWFLISLYIRQLLHSMNRLMYIVVSGWDWNAGVSQRRLYCLYSQLFFF